MPDYYSPVANGQKNDATRLPSVYITPDAKIKLDLYIDEVSSEVSGLGTVEILGKDNFLITDVFLFRQECTDIRTELSSADIAKFLVMAEKEGRDSSLVKLWWHSHVDMPVFWSNEDEGTAGKFANGFMISLVTNKHRKYLCRLDMYKPFRLIADNLSFQVLLEANDALREKIKREVAEKVHIKKRKLGIFDKKNDFTNIPNIIYEDEIGEFNDND